MVGHRSTGLPECGPTESSAPEPCFNRVCSIEIIGAFYYEHREHLLIGSNFFSFLKVLIWDFQVAESPCTYTEGCGWVKGPLLGSGAFSCCYQSRDIRTGALMALKLVSFVRNSEEEQVRGAFVLPLR